jgi:hypothetical protein
MDMKIPGSGPHLPEEVPSEPQAKKSLSLQDRALSSIRSLHRISVRGSSMAEMHRETSPMGFQAKQMVQILAEVLVSSSEQKIDMGISNMCLGDDFVRHIVTNLPEAKQEPFWKAMARFLGKDENALLERAKKNDIRGLKQELDQEKIAAFVQASFQNPDVVSSFKEEMEKSS